MTNFWIRIVQICDYIHLTVLGLQITRVQNAS